ncbi:MAG TPA: WD40 repeat domain-containing protein [Gemmataceae bacterium]|nr:WD40 repeat domain-containing protein [Gemmataceae bacterium]
MSHPRSGEGRYPPLLDRFTPIGYGLARFFLGFVGLSLLPSAVSGADESLSLRGHTKRVSGLAYSPDGGNDGKLFLWDLKGDRRTAFPDEHGEVLAAASAGHSRTTVWDLPRGRRRHRVDADSSGSSRPPAGVSDASCSAKLTPRRWAS